MKIILTENQIEFIRRYKKIKDLVDEGIDVLSNDEDVCGYTYSDFIEEICWQVSDHLEDLNMETETVGTIEKVQSTFSNEKVINYQSEYLAKYNNLALLRFDVL